MMTISNNWRQERPIIAFLAHQVTDISDTDISASYVKYVYSAGVRVVPIRTHFGESTIRYQLACVNGLLLPGGAAEI